MSDMDDEPDDGSTLADQVCDAVESVLGPLSSFVVVYDERTLTGDLREDSLRFVTPDHLAVSKIED